MKKFLAFSAAVGIVATLSANTIDWSLPNLQNADNGTINYQLGDIVFIPTAAPTSYDSTEGVITGTPGDNGSNILIDQETGENGYMAGTWTDDLNSSTTYYMAYKGKDGTFYSINDGTGAAVTVTSSDDPLKPGDPNATVDLATDNTTVHTVNHTVVPEPATAVLALAGVAMLIRRRKA